MPFDALNVEPTVAAPRGDKRTAAPPAPDPSGGKVVRVVEVFRRGVRARIFVGALAAALCGYFVWGAVTSEQGLLAYLEMRKTLERLRQENLAHLRKNAQLEKEIYLLRHSPAYLEKVAREEFGYVREGEVLFWFSDQRGEPEPGPHPSESLATEGASCP